ncbi:restriction endonuclease subunit S [Oceanobacillus longus]|uniref:Restriction endonuclease subunit S n=1 Tax=Oceanobacillus longus TaxID=930120 RepID=A0ABV8H5M7_9BACI
MGNKLTPEIRFPGFTGDWEQRQLGEISVKVTEKNKDNIYSETLTNSAEFGIITQRDFFEKDISNKKNIDGYYIVHPDYFVYNPRISNFAPVGPIKRNKLGRTGIMSPLYYVFRTHDVDKTYLEYYFSGNGWHRFMNLNGDSGARSDRFAIKDSVFSEMPIPIPSIEEQVEVGNLFTELDDTISIRQQELDTLKQTKQGFLQKMFPKKGETIPEIRFPGFTGTWEECKVEDIALVSTGNRDTQDALEDGKYDFYVRSPKIEKINSYSYDGEAVLTVGDGVGVGKVFHYVTGKFDYHQRVYKVSDFKDFNGLFFYYYFSDNFIYESRKYNAKTSVDSVRREMITKMNIPNPNIEEQTQIGMFFKQIDDTITLHRQELETLKQTKKAFLQKMFV